MEALQAIESWRARGRPLLLDGGLGGELEARGHDVSSPLWSAALIAHQPGVIARLHRDYLDAGAHCITTSSYQASVPGLRAQGVAMADIEQLFQRSVDLALDAREAYLRDHPEFPFRPLIAASVGPYGAYLADGSEYRGNYGIGDDALREFHRQRLRWLDRSGADLIACETLPDLDEARVLSELLAAVTTPAWVSFCCRDATHLHDGNRLEQALELFAGLPRVFALGVNCCPPTLIDGLIESLCAAGSGKMIVVYPNSGQQYDAAGKHWHGDADLGAWSRRAAAWFAAGADIIGGCCHVGPEYVRRLSARESWHC